MVSRFALSRFTNAQIRGTEERMQEVYNEYIDCMSDDGNKEAEYFKPAHI